jgi:hypothetical protein
MLWHFLQHDEKTKTIGKQRGMKEREQGNNKIEHNIHYMIKLQINLSLGLQVGIKQMVVVGMEQQHGPMMLNSISMNKQYGSLEENQNSKATNSN